MAPDDPVSTPFKITLEQSKGQLAEFSSLSQIPFPQGRVGLEVPAGLFPPVPGSPIGLHVGQKVGLDVVGAGEDGFVDGGGVSCAKRGLGASVVGKALGLLVGEALGRSVGFLVGARVGLSEGIKLGPDDGSLLGSAEGLSDGKQLGSEEGWKLGSKLGVSEGIMLGSEDGSLLG